jgi:hypothetical protein
MGVDFSHGWRNSSVGAAGRSDGETDRAGRGRAVPPQVEPDRRADEKVDKIGERLAILVGIQVAMLIAGVVVVLLKYKP